MSSNFIETQNPGANSDFCCKYIGEYPQICRKIKGQVRLRLLLDPRVLIASILGFILCVYMPINSVFLFCWWVWHEPGWYNILFLCLQILWLPFFAVYTGIMSSAFFRYDSLHIDISWKTLFIYSRTWDFGMDMRYSKLFTPFRSRFFQKGSFAEKDALLSIGNVLYSLEYNGWQNGIAIPRKSVTLHD